MTQVPKDHEFFVAVGSPETAMSSVWRIWTWPGESDIYISEKGSVGVTKASLHRDGTYRVAFAQQFVRAEKARGNWPQRSRVIDEWRSSEIAPGIQMPFRLILPASELRPPPRDWSTKKPVLWLEAPEPAQAIELRLYLGNTAVRDSITIQSSDAPIAKLWDRPLSNGWVLVIVAKVILVPPEMRAAMEQVRRTLTASIQMHSKQLDGSRLRLRTTGSADDGSRHFIDMAFDLRQS